MMGLGRHVSHRWAALAILALAASSCDEAEPAGPAPAISISLSGSTVTITQGQTGTVSVTLTRQNGFADAVAVTVEGLPTGVTAAALSLPASSTSGTLTFTAASTAVVGTTALTVRATGPGVTAVTASLSLTVNAAPTPSFTMSLSATSLSIPQGASGTSTVTITRAGGFAGAVNLAATGLPAGVTAAFNPAPATAGTSTLTLTASSTAATGSANVTVTCSGTGVSNQTSTLALTVTAGAVGSISIGLSPTTISVQQGNSVTSTVTLTRLGGFNGPVSLAATGLPAGVTASFNPTSFTTGVTSTLTLAASATAATGIANVTVTASAAAVANATGTIGLTVTAAPTGGGNVSIAFCPSIGVPLWVAFQDGTGAWAASTAVAGVYSGTVNSGRGGVAYVTAVASGGFQLNVRYGTTAELGAFNTVFCYGATGTGKTVNVTVAGTALTDIALLALGTSPATASFGVTPVFNNVPDGMVDLLGARAAINTTTGAITVNKMFAQRGITPAANSTVAVDFAGTNAVDPATGTITIANLGTDQAILGGFYLTANRTTLAYPIDTGGATTTRTFLGFPTVAGSFHLIQATAVPNLQTFTSIRAAAVVSAAVGARTLTFGSDLGTVTVTAASTTPVLRPQAVIPVGSYTGSWTASYTQGGSGANYRAAAVQATAGYVGGSPTSVTLVIPDLSAGGFQTLWGLFDATTNWNVSAQALTGFGAQGQWQDGATLLFASRTGTLAAQQEEERQQEE